MKMLSIEKMKDKINTYYLDFDEKKTKVRLTVRHNLYCVMSTKRAIKWVKLGIQDLGGRSKEEMLSILNSWIKIKKMKIFIVVGQGYYDTSSYSVSSYNYTISKHSTLSKAKKDIKSRSVDSDCCLFILELDTNVNADEIAELDANANLV